MNGIISNIKDFYVYYHTLAEIKRENPYEWVIKTSLCKRRDFVSAALDGLAFLVHNLALAAFSALAVVFTAGLVRRFRASFFKNAYEGVVHAGSIFVSIGGILSPQTINQDFLKLNANEYRQAIEPGALTDTASLLGGMIVRRRPPIELARA